MAFLLYIYKESGKVLVGAFLTKNQAEWFHEDREPDSDYEIEPVALMEYKRLDHVKDYNNKRNARLTESLERTGPK